MNYIANKTVFFIRIRKFGLLYKPIEFGKIPTLPLAFVHHKSLRYIQISSTEIRTNIVFAFIICIGL